MNATEILEYLQQPHIAVPIVLATFPIVVADCFDDDYLWQMRGYMAQTFGRFFPITQFEEMTRQNMALFQNAAQPGMAFESIGQFVEGLIPK